MLEKLKLFDTKVGFLVFLLSMFLLFSFNIFLKYKDFQTFKTSYVYHCDATVLNQYPKFSKRGKKYFVLRLKSDDGFDFITTNFGDLKNLKGRRLRVAIITKNVNFLEYLKGFFAPAFDLELLEYKPSIKNSLKTYIDSQHSHRWTKELFEALFLAIPVSKEFRKRVSNLGINHLLAISGYHLGFLYGMILFLSIPLYKFFQKRFFPYRNRTFDLSVFAISILLFYIYVIGFTPSILRSLSMLIFALFLYMRWFKIVSFEVLSVTVLFLLSMKVELLFSISFWFSVSGIFLIYLFLHHFKDLKNYQTLLAINFWVYLTMIPIVHYIFPLFTPLQLLSPFLSLAFIVFYPLELFLHLIGYGALLDPILLDLFNLQSNGLSFYTPPYLLIIYIFLMIGAIFSKKILYLLLFFATLFLLRALISF